VALTVPNEVLNPIITQEDGFHLSPKPPENPENHTSSQPTDLGGLTRTGQFPPEISTLLQTVRQIAQFSSLTFHVHRLARCEGGCQCICHSHSRFQSPKLLNQFFGALFIGYAGLPIITRQCNVDICTNQYSRTVHISYTFPGWFLSRTVDLVAATTYTGEPSFGVKVRNRANYGSENSIFKYARDGNIPGIIEMFKKRKASPNDLSYDGGYSILHFPLELGHIETCKFLLDLGVDPYFEDDNGRSPAQEVSSYILSSKGTTPLAKAYESTFFGISSSHSELWDFSYVHRVVVGIQPTDLFNTLKEPDRKSEINKVDKARRTPLIWAALRGDDEAVRTLLQAGADITLRDYEGHTALHAALQSPSLRCVELLLMAGSSVPTRDMYGDTALQIATWSHRPCLPDSNVPIIEALYLAGAAVNARQNKGNSAIQSAACLNRVANAKYLLSIGADPNNRDHAGDVPIFECLFYNTHGMLDLLLRCPKTRLDNVNNAGQNILHFAALYADLQSMEMLIASRLCGMSLDTRDSQGRTAKEAFEDRTFAADARLRMVFDRLLEKAGQGDDVGRAGEDDDEDEEEEQFVDAVEVLSLA
jgi:ankyrin repeat protein